MATQNDVRKIALSLPGTTEGTDRFAFSVEIKGKQKGFVWVWLERKDPKKARTPCPTVLAVRVRDQAEKAVLLAAIGGLLHRAPLQRLPRRPRPPAQGPRARCAS
jgi:hypothetical protein